MLYLGSQEKGISNTEEIFSAVLKLYWKPYLSVSRKHGGFRVRVYDNTKANIYSIMDAKRINYRCNKEEEG